MRRGLRRAGSSTKEAFASTRLSHAERRAGKGRAAFLEDCTRIYGDRYDYSQLGFGRQNHDKIRVICRVHGPSSISPSVQLVT